MAGLTMDEEFPHFQEAEAIIHGDSNKAGEAVIQEHKKKCSYLVFPDLR